MKRMPLLALLALLVAACSGSDSTGPGARSVAGTWQGSDFISCVAAPQIREVTQRLVLTQDGDRVTGTRQVPTCTGAAGPLAPVVGTVSRDIVRLSVTPSTAFEGTISENALTGQVFVQIGPNTDRDRGAAYTFTRVR